MRIKPIFAWYDLWVGLFWDSKKRLLYILPLLCLGIVVDFTRYYAIESEYADIGDIGVTTDPSDAPKGAKFRRISKREYDAFE